MRSAQIPRIGLLTLRMILLAPGAPAVAWAQTASTPERPLLPHIGSSVERWLGASGSGITPPQAVALLLALLALAVVIVGSEVLDRARDRRDSEAALLQARIADALLRDRRVMVLAVAATVRLPLWRRSRATIELWGRVPTVEHWQAVLRVAGQVASQVLAAPHLLDRITIDPFMEAWAA